MKTVKYLTILLITIAVSSAYTKAGTIDIDGVNDKKEVFENVYMVGDATPAGWDITNPYPMRKSESNPHIFTYSGFLNAGEMKLPLESGTGNWDCNYLMPIQNGANINSKHVMFVSKGNPDNKWVISKAGIYSVTLDTDKMTIDFKRGDLMCDEIFMIGDATPADWNIEDPVPMRKSSESPYIFIFAGQLKAGELKLPLAKGSWDCDYLMPKENGASIKDKNLMFVSKGKIDNKWVLKEEGGYRITVDTKKMSIKFEKDAFPYDGVYMIGSATPAEWNISAPTPMKMEKAGIYTYQGPLKAGELKFPLESGTGNWDCDYLMPIVGGAGVEETRIKLIPGGNPDNKFWIREAGTYKVSLDTKNMSIKFEKQ
ncbi:SusF/SusE family outer membrane protein [Prevotella sp. 10(H)]|uniref:SusF/SusE family outer membrane protein n=1 Tax=Prevotella sp. 10(H) TaxID=1158294 RepID=UPI0004A71A08|nr:SusF/SusE family outer membrane protein [Prevotella sp. 10(H)]